MAAPMAFASGSAGVGTQQRRRRWKKRGKIRGGRKKKNGGQSSKNPRGLGSAQDRRYDRGSTQDRRYDRGSAQDPPYDRGYRMWDFLCWLYRHRQGMQQGGSLLEFEAMAAAADQTYAPPAQAWTPSTLLHATGEVKGGRAAGQGKGGGATHKGTVGQKQTKQRQELQGAKANQEPPISQAQQVHMPGDSKGRKGKKKKICEADGVTYKGAGSCGDVNEVAQADDSERQMPLERIRKKDHGAEAGGDGKEKGVPASTEGKKKRSENEIGASGEEEQFEGTKVKRKSKRAEEAEGRGEQAAECGKRKEEQIEDEVPLKRKKKRKNREEDDEDVGYDSRQKQVEKDSVSPLEGKKKNRDAAKAEGASGAGKQAEEAALEDENASDGVKRKRKPKDEVSPKGKDKTSGKPQVEEGSLKEKKKRSHEADSSSKRAPESANVSPKGNAAVERAESSQAASKKHREGEVKDEDADGKRRAKHVDEAGEMPLKGKKKNREANDVGAEGGEGPDSRNLKEHQVDAEVVEAPLKGKKKKKKKQDADDIGAEAGDAAVTRKRKQHDEAAETAELPVKGKEKKNRDANESTESGKRKDEHVDEAADTVQTPLKRKKTVKNSGPDEDGEAELKRAEIPLKGKKKKNREAGDAAADSDDSRKRKEKQLDDGPPENKKNPEGDGVAAPLKGKKRTKSSELDDVVEAPPKGKKKKSSEVDDVVAKGGGAAESSKRKGKQIAGTEESSKRKGKQIDDGPPENKNSEGDDVATGAVDEVAESPLKGKKKKSSEVDNLMAKDGERSKRKGKQIEETEERKNCGLDGPAAKGGDGTQEGVHKETEHKEKEANQQEREVNIGAASGKGTKDTEALGEDKERPKTKTRKRKSEAGSGGCAKAFCANCRHLLTPSPCREVEAGPLLQRLPLSEIAAVPTVTQLPFDEAGSSTSVEAFPVQALPVQAAKRKSADPTVREVIMPSQRKPIHTEAETDAYLVKKPVRSGKRDVLIWRSVDWGKQGPPLLDKATELSALSDVDKVIPRIRKSGGGDGARVNEMGQMRKFTSRKLKNMYFSPAPDRHLVTSGLDGTFCFMKFDSNLQLLSTVTLPPGVWAEDFTWHPSGESVFSVFGKDKNLPQVAMVNPSSPDVTWFGARGHDPGKELRGIQFMPWTQPDVFVTTGSDHAVVIWREEHEEWKPRRLYEHSSNVYKATGTRHKNWVISAGMDKRCLIYDVGAAAYHSTTSGERLETFLGTYVNPVDPNLLLLQAGEADKQLNLYDLRQRIGNTPLHVFGWSGDGCAKSKSGQYFAEWSPCGFKISLGSRSSCFFIFDIRSNSKTPYVKTSVPGRTMVLKAAWHPSIANTLLTVTSTSTLGLYKVAS